MNLLADVLAVGYADCGRQREGVVTAVTVPGSND